MAISHFDCLSEEINNSIPALMTSKAWSKMPMTDTRHLHHTLRYSYCSRSKPEEQFSLCSLFALQSHLTFPFLSGRSRLKTLPQQLSNKPLYFTAQPNYSWSRSVTTVRSLYQAHHILTNALKKKIIPRSSGFRSLALTVTKTSQHEPH